jgi:3-oxoacyl-[acyl-carrier-protein] synthase-3
MAIEIRGTGKWVPEKRLTNADLAGKIDTTDEWIRSHTGIGARHLAEEDEATSDLALRAGMRALEAAAAGGEIPEKSPEEIIPTLDLIVLGTTTPDYIGCPATACVIQDRLGAKKAAALDVSAACSSFIYGLETAAGLLEISDTRRRALVIGGEVLSRITNWNDRGTSVLFGDGAGALFIEKTDAPRQGPGKRGLLRSILRADGAGAENLMVRNGGGRNPYKAGDLIDVPPHVEMNGRAVYNFAVKALTDIIVDLLAEEHAAIDEVRRIVPHQANARIVQAAGKRLGIPEEKFFLNIEDYANTSAASIPIALDELSRGGSIKKGDLIMTVGFGAGLTYGGNLIIW